VNSLADGLSPEIAQQIHPDWRRNEASYWLGRDRLLEEYRSRWIGAADGSIIASGSSPVRVFHQAQASGLHPFVTCVGQENEPTRMRRSSLACNDPNRTHTRPGSARWRRMPERPASGFPEIRT
jgi:hypothetical protein